MLLKNECMTTKYFGDEGHIFWDSNVDVLHH